MEPQLVLVSGKGGVGKSAVAAARALTAARAGKRALSFEPVEVEPGLHASMIDLGEAMAEYLRLQLGVPTPRIGLIAKAFEVLANTAPGIREIITIGKAIHESQRERWDLVVLDAPPTGQLASFVRAPRTVSELVPTGRVRQQSAWMESVLAEATELVLVTLLEELPVVETTVAMAELAALGMTGEPTIVANRVLDSLELSAGWQEHLAAGPHRDAALLHLALEAGQAEWRSVLGESITLPYLFGVLTPPEVAARLHEELL
jgi:anion-transporting  ArsA/GET3 family ATPase